MRQLNTSTLNIEEFDDSKIPPYAMLSHAWGKKEVSFQDMSDPTKRVSYQGYNKVIGTCKVLVNEQHRARLAIGANGYGSTRAVSKNRQRRVDRTRRWDEARVSKPEKIMSKDCAEPEPE